MPTINFTNCSNAKIYVNTITNTPHPDCRLNLLTFANASPEITGDGNLKSQELLIKPLEGRKFIIRYDSKKEDCASPSITVEIPPLSSEGNSKIKSMPYVITVSGEEALIASSGTQALPVETADHDKIQAENVILNSPDTKTINLGPGAGAINLGLHLEVSIYCVSAVRAAGAAEK